MQVTVDVKVVSKMSPSLVLVEQPTKICHVCKGNTGAYHSCDYPLVGLMCMAWLWLENIKVNSELEEWNPLNVHSKQIGLRVGLTLKDQGRCFFVQAFISARNTSIYICITIVSIWMH